MHIRFKCGGQVKGKTKLNAVHLWPFSFSSVLVFSLLFLPHRLDSVNPGSYGRGLSCDPIGCSLPGSSPPGIHQASILE